MLIFIVIMGILVITLDGYKDDFNCLLCVKFIEFVKSIDFTGV